MSLKKVLKNGSLLKETPPKSDFIQKVDLLKKVLKKENLLKISYSKKQLKKVHSLKKILRKELKKRRGFFYKIKYVLPS